MGVLVTFESVQMLLQREDFPAALRALKKLAKDAPDVLFHDAPRVAKCKDLASALVAAEFPGTFDEHGDLVGLRFVGGKLPPGATDDFPDHLLFAWKKHLRDGVFDRWIEGTREMRFFVDRGTVRAMTRLPQDRRLEQIGPEPRCRPGDEVQLSFRYVSTSDTAAVPVRLSTPDEWCRAEFAERTMRPGEEATVVARIAERATFEERRGLILYGDGLRIHGHLMVTLDVEDDLEQAHDVIATESPPNWWSGTFVPAKKVATAVEDMHRYAARHATTAGGEFLARVGSATDIGAALREAGFEPTLEAGAVQRLAFSAPRLPGRERFVLGLLRSFAGVTTATGQVRLAYASSPTWWTELAFTKATLRRLRRPRADSAG